MCERERARAHARMPHTARCHTLFVVGHSGADAAVVLRCIPTPHRSGLGALVLVCVAASLVYPTHCAHTLTHTHEMQANPAQPERVHICGRVPSSAPFSLFSLRSFWGAFGWKTVTFVVVDCSMATANTFVWHTIPTQ